MPGLGSDELVRAIAESMDAEPELVPFLPVLLADLEDLGARARDVVAVLAHAALSPGQTGLDLGCGKGAAALAVAETFLVSVEGVDGLAPFVRHAETRARERGLADRCRFAVGDVRTRVAQGDEKDFVMLLALGDVLGSPPDTVARLRGCVRPGGYMLLDDAYLADDVERLPEDLREELVDCLDREATAAALEAHGDRVVHMRVVDGPGDHAHYREMTARIAERCEELAPRHPELADLILDYAARQCEEVALLSGPVVGAMWLLQRGP